MRSLSSDEFTSEFFIYQQLSIDKSHKTFSALAEGSDGIPFPVILKEIDEKRVAIYQELCGMWNPYLADTYEVLCISNSTTAEQLEYFAVTEYVYARNSPKEERLSLSQFVQKNGPVNEQTALLISAQFCDGLKEFHKKGFVHRDLKPDNIMISKYDSQFPQIKIVDFGGAKWNNPSKKNDTTVIGTLGYQAPESLTTQTTNRADIYSIGCILNFLLTGQEPGLVKYNKNPMQLIFQTKRLVRRIFRNCRLRISWFWCTVAVETEANRLLENWRNWDIRILWKLVASMTGQAILFQKSNIVTEDLKSF